MGDEENMYSIMKSNNNHSSIFGDKSIFDNKRPSAVSFEWKSMKAYPSIMFYFTWKITIIPEKENIQAYEIAVFSCAEVLGQVSYFLNDNREQVEWTVGIPWNGNSFGEVVQAVVRVKINNRWSNWSDSAIISMNSNRISNPVHNFLSPTKQQQVDRRIRGFSSTSVRFQHSLRPARVMDGLVSDPSSYIFLFPGAGGFGLNSGSERLYSSINEDFSVAPTNAHVITVSFDDYTSAQTQIIEVMAQLILLLPESAPVVFIGWSFGGAVALELAVKFKRRRNIVGVVTIAGQGAEVAGKNRILGIEDLDVPLLFIAGTADSAFGGAGGAIRIATEFHRRAERSADKRLYIIPGAWHDCQGCKSYLYDWLTAHLRIF